MTAPGSSPQGAQITLDSFDIPDFPASARTLKALSLTSSINAANYRTKLGNAFTISKSIPPGIESLTLELFGQGYPSGFLSQLATRLPNLKSVVVYSQLLSGLTGETQQDAVQFFKSLPNLRALHLLDVFARPGLFETAAQWLKYNTSEVPGEARRGLMFLEANYTFDHTDDSYMSKIASSELPALIGPGLISCSFGISPPEPESSSDISENAVVSESGIMAFNTPASVALVKALTDEATYPRGLRALNTTLYTMTLDGLSQVLARHKNIMMLTATIETEPGSATRKKLLGIIEHCPYLEQIDLVAHPTIPFFMELTQNAAGILSSTFPGLEDLQSIAEKLPKLKSFKVDILRSSQFGSLAFTKAGEQWKSAS